MTIDPFIVGELKADGGKGEAVKPYERHDPDNATAPFLSFIPDAKRDELIGALLESLERSDQRETDFYMVRSFIGGLGLLAAQFAPQAECAPQQTDAEALYEAWQNTIKHMDAQAECAPLQTDAEALYELPERVIDQLYQSAGVSTFHPDGDQREKLYAFANAVAAETVARIAAPTPERADADTAGAKPTCPHCGLTDIEFSRVCHNSACSGYAKEESFYRGWENTVAPASQERADAGKDAARYRWLREQDDSGPLFVMYGSNGTWGECGHSDIYGELLDESIDEEIAKEAKK